MFFLFFVVAVVAVCFLISYFDPILSNRDLKSGNPIQNFPAIFNVVVGISELRGTQVLSRSTLRVRMITISMNFHMITAQICIKAPWKQVDLDVWAKGQSFPFHLQ